MQLAGASARNRPRRGRGRAKRVWCKARCIRVARAGAHGCAPPPCFRPPTPTPAALQPTPGPRAVTQAPQPAPHLALRLPAGAGSSEDTGGSRLRTESRGRHRRRHHRAQPPGSGTWRDPVHRAGSVLVPRKKEPAASPPGCQLLRWGPGEAVGAEGGCGEPQGQLWGLQAPAAVVVCGAGAGSGVGGGGQIRC